MVYSLRTKSEAATLLSSQNKLHNNNTIQRVSSLMNQTFCFSEINHTNSLPYKHLFVNDANIILFSNYLYLNTFSVTRLRGFFVENK